MRGEDRSRSPGRWGEWISRQIAGFGRYPDKRPNGLNVDSNGEMQMSSLMDAWGRKQGLSEKDITEAIEKHTYHERGDLRRFTLETDDSGEAVITVHQKRGGWGGRPVSTPARTGAVRDQAWSAEQKSDSRGTNNDDSGKSWQSGSSWNWRDNGRSWQGGGEGDWKRDKGWQKSTSWNRNDSWQHGDSQGQHDNGEKVQRYLGWILKRGHEDLSLTVHSGGWAMLADLASAMQERRPDLNITDGEGLRRVLQDTDTAGRFEIHGGSVRKLERNHRQLYASASGGEHDGEAAQEEEEAIQAEPPMGTPSPPPGEHWSKFHDNGIMWWYYEGPLGKWWCQDERDIGPSQPMPYPDGD
jgi:hypothetical protein